jgi:molecular chaperone DnaK (HSP70)
MSAQSNKIFGIDLGTTYSSIAYVDEYGKPVVVPNSENQRVTPSVVFFDGDNVVVGDVAKESAKLYPDEVASFVKRSMGEPDFSFEHESTSYRAEELSGFILRKLVQDAEQNFGEKITDVVITCPAYFGINEREATRAAGEIAGFNVRQIINEPTAAAIAYGAAKENEKKVVLVYDLGGGTFDVTMIDIRPDSIEVVCTGGDHNLGGKDWDDRIVAYLVQEFRDQTGIVEDILEDPDTCQDLQITAEKSKKVLSQREKTPISITHGGERIKTELKRDKFEEITQDLLERTIALTHETLKQAGKKGYQTFDEIILVGGSTRMPKVIARLGEEFSKAPKLYEPEEAVAKGAAIFGWKLTLNDSLVARIAQKTNTSVEEVSENFDSIAEGVKKETAREVANETGYTLPAVEDSMISIKDVVSKSFGVVVRNPQDEEIVFNLIRRNTPVPARRTKTFSTAIENQLTVLVQIMENESSEETIPTSQALQIGSAVLNLPPGLPADLPIEIFFKLNKEGRLDIAAIETSKSLSVEAMIETDSVIKGEALEKAKARNQSLVIH